MNSEKERDNTVIDEETGEIIEIDPKRYEVIDYEGEEGRFYPETGAIFTFSEEYNRWLIKANRGGRRNFDGAAMVAQRELKKEQAILDGLADASLHFDGRTASDMLRKIVAARAKNAIEDDGRTGNADAKFVFSLVAQDSQGKEEGPALSIDMDANTAAGFIEAVKELMAKKDQTE